MQIIKSIIKYLQASDHAILIFDHRPFTSSHFIPIPYQAFFQKTNDRIAGCFLQFYTLYLYKPYRKIKIINNCVFRLINMLVKNAVNHQMK